MSDKCPECDGPMPIGSWPFCKGDPAVHLQPVRYGWAFKQGQNDSRREQFFKDSAANPFGGMKDPELEG